MRLLIRALESLVLQDQPHLRVRESGLLLHRLIHELHDPVVRVGRKPISLLWIKSVKRIDETFNAGCLEILVVEVVSPLEDPRTNQSERRAQQRRLGLLTFLAQTKKL